MDAEMLQAIGIIGAMMVAQLALLTGLLRRQLNIMERRMDANHRELKGLIIGHFHPDGGEAAFRLPQPAGG